MFHKAKYGQAMVLAAALCVPATAYAQDIDRGRVQDRDRVTRLVPGVVLPIRTQEAIDVERWDNQVYAGTVDRDVRGDDGQLAIPRGSKVELIVRVTRDKDLILDLDSVMVNGQRYAIRVDQNRVESQRDNSVVGAIFGAINGGQATGRAVRIPRDTIVTFRLERPLDMGVADGGVMRDGRHYHDWYRDNRNQDDRIR